MTRLVPKIFTRIKTAVKIRLQKMKKFLTKLIYPIYFFPFKLISYSLYYLTKLIIRFIISILRIILDAIVFPFRSLRNFLKSVFIILLVAYILVSLIVMADYIKSNYGRYSKFLCAPNLNEKLRHSVVRVVGGYSEGSGFFISDHEILTNFHVITGEPSPKIIFWDGSFTAAKSIVGDKEADLALITVEGSYPNMVLEMMIPMQLVEEEPLIAAGFPLGTEITGEVTITGGKFIAPRRTRKSPVGYLQTNINLVEGMSGGPLVDKCGQVVGVNTAGVSGASFFIASDFVNTLKYSFTDKDVTKLDLDPSASPEKAVEAYYTYLKVRDMKAGFDLLSTQYLAKTNFDEWTGRFTNIIDVVVFKTEKVVGKRDTVFVKFMTQNWVDGEVERHLYEGTWQTIFEDGKYKMLSSQIKEVVDPDYIWFYE